MSEILGMSQMRKRRGFVFELNDSTSIFDAVPVDVVANGR